MPVKKVTSNKLKVTTPAAKKAGTVVVKKAPVKEAIARKTGSISIDLFDTKGKIAGNVALPQVLFGAKINKPLMAQAVRVYLANQRQGNASTKSRGEIDASKRKIYRQKGTGRARHGAKSAPIFVGGGIAFGPKPRDHSLSLSKKMRTAAFASALTSRLKDKAVRVVVGLEKIEPKTKVMQDALTKIKGERSGMKILLVLPEKTDSVQRGARNIEGVTIRPVNLLNTYEVLNTNLIMFMKDAITKLEDTWNKQK